MTTFRMPALDGRLPLGFLAACGVTRLLTGERASSDPPIRLSWDEQTGSAVLTGASDLDEVIDELHRIALAIPEEARLPDGPANFPGIEKLPDSPRGDPMRLLADHFRDRVNGWRVEYGTDFVDMWVPAMVTDQIVDDVGCVSISPFAAPSGQQKFATMFQFVLDMVRKDPGLLRQALIGWRRVDGVTGEYLDHHVLQSAADRSDGRSREAGVPGATWLALMALPWFPVHADRRVPLASGWQSTKRGRRYVNHLVWPLWSEPLDPDAIATLLTHPDLALKSPDDGDRGTETGRPRVDLERLRPLSVFAVGAAERRRISGRNFAGVLTPVQIETGRRPGGPRTNAVESQVF